MTGTSGTTIGTTSPASRRASAITADQVAEFLIEHPDFLVQHPEILDRLRAPARSLGDPVVDFQVQLVERQRSRMDALKGELGQLVETSRANLDQQHRLFDAVLRLLESPNFEALIETVTGELAPLLGVDAIGLAVESIPGREVSLAVALRTGVRVVPEGTVFDRLGSGDAVLRADITGDVLLFGDLASIIHSEAVLRLNWSPSAPPGLLAFGSADPEGFHPGQGTEQITFLARVIERVLSVWLDVADE